MDSKITYVYLFIGKHAHRTTHTPKENENEFEDEKMVVKKISTKQISTKAFTRVHIL